MQTRQLTRPGASSSRRAAARHAQPALSGLRSGTARVHRAQQPLTQSSRACRTARHVVCFQDNNSSNGLPTLEPPAAEAAAEAKRKLTVSWAGAGVFFFWQLGATKYLAEKYDLTKVPMVGASGGSLAAVLAACGVDADSVLEKAYQMSMKHNIWEKPRGLLGMWGSFIEQWLDELLPDNAHELCRNRITVVVTTIPRWQQIGITDFTSKKDLINACMASSHVPFFLDYKLSRKFRGRRCVDGSFPDFFSGVNCELLREPPGAGGAAVVFDYYDDTMLKRKGRMDMLEVKSYEEIRRMYELGYEYAAKLHADGRFVHYELAEVMLQGEGGHMQEVLVPGGTTASINSMGSAGSSQLTPASSLEPQPALVSASASNSLSSSSSGLSMYASEQGEDVPAGEDDDDVADLQAQGGEQGHPVQQPSSSRQHQRGLVLDLQQEPLELARELSRELQHHK